MGTQEYRAGRLAQAERIYRDVLQSFPDSFLALLNLAGVLCDQLRLDEAMEVVARALRIQPGEPLLRIEGTAYSGSGQPLRYTDALYRGDIFRFSVDTTKPSDLRVVVRSQETTDQPTDTNTGDKP